MRGQQREREEGALGPPTVSLPLLWSRPRQPHLDPCVLPGGSHPPGIPRGDPLLGVPGIPCSEPHSDFHHVQSQSHRGPRRDLAPACHFHLLCTPPHPHLPATELSLWLPKPSGLFSTPGPLHKPFLLPGALCS